MSDATKDILGKIVEDILLDHIENNSSEIIEENANEIVEKIEETMNKPELSIDTTIEQIETEIKESLSLQIPSSFETIEIENTKETLTNVAEGVDERFSICCFFSKKQ
jgi:hypothetical protein